MTDITKIAEALRKLPVTHACGIASIKLGDALAALAEYDAARQEPAPAQAGTVEGRPEQHVACEKAHRWLIAHDWHRDGEFFVEVNRNGAQAIHVSTAALIVGAALASREAQPAVPKGWKLVPEEPTSRMVDEVEKASRMGGIWTSAAIYRAMLAAAPSPTAETGEA